MGLLLGLKHRRRIFLPIGLGLLAQGWFYSGLEFLGLTFGYRYLCVFLPALALGAGWIYSVEKRGYRVLWKTATVIAFLYNALLVVMAPVSGWMEIGRAHV